MLGRDFEFAPLSEVLADNAAGGGSRRLAVTFDDGFDLIAGGALDVLDAHGVKATSFVLTAMLDNRGLMWRNKLSAIQALRPAERYLAAYNAIADRAGLPHIGDATELLSSAMGWDMARKDELADLLWGACDMPPLSEFLDEHRPYFTADGLATWLARGARGGAALRDASRLLAPRRRRRTGRDPRPGAPLVHRPGAGVGGLLVPFRETLRS